MSKVSQETLDSWYRQLDSIRTLAQNAQEEYTQYLNEFEIECGKKLREEYEEKYLC